MDPVEEAVLVSKTPPVPDTPRVHAKCHNRPHTSPHVLSSGTSNPSTSGLQAQDSMKTHDEEVNTGRDKDNKEACVSDWLSGGPLGSKGVVLVFRSCVLASRTPSMESTTKSTGQNTGTAILLNKAKNMARRLVPEPHTFKPNNIMHEVMETFGNSNKFAGQAYVVRHVSESEVPETISIEEQGHETLEHKRDIEDVLKDLSKITLKKHLNIENTTANIKPPEDPPPPAVEEKKNKKNKGKNKRKTNIHKKISETNLQTGSPMDSDDSEQLVKEVDSVKVLESNCMPARLLKITYKLVNTETKLLNRLLQAHGLVESVPDAKDFNLLWSGLHPKPDVLRSLSPYQRVNHFPRSYELTRKDKLFKNIEKMQYFRGLKHFDFIPTTFLMPAEFKELCTAHYRTKGPWIVKPAASSRGRGIYIVNTPEQIPKGENVVVAKYIDKPLLIGGHKCDLRLYVCVTSIDPLLIYLYEEGLVRFATVKYDKTNKNLWNPCMHLCNYSINKYHTDYIKCDDPNAGNIGHKWTLSALLRHLRKQGRNTTALMASIEDLVVKSVLSSAQTITAAARVFVPNFFNCFELFGYDILVDDMLKPWLLEINLSPSLACESPLDARVKSALLADTLTLVGLPAVSMGKTEAAPQNSLKMRIGACRRVHSAENVCAGRTNNKPSGQTSPAALTSEELRLVRAVRAQYARRGGFVRIFPSQNSWQKYAQYLDPVSGIPVCSTSLNNNVPYNVVPHNYNLLVHAHVLPHFAHATAATSTSLAPQPMPTPTRLKRYETVTITSTAPAINLSEHTPTPAPNDSRHAKSLVKKQLADGMRLTMGEVRRAFGLYLTHVLKRISCPSNELGAAHAALVLRFLKRASNTLRMPYNVKGPSAKMCDKDRCAVVAKQLNDFLYMYYRETDLYTDSEDRENCVSNINFAQFLYSASEADLEDVLLLQLKMEHYVTLFLSDTRAPYCVDLPSAKLGGAARHTLLKYLACLAPINTRRYRYLSDTRAPYCVDLPSAKLGGAARHTLLKYLACLAPINTRRYRYLSDTRAPYCVDLPSAKLGGAARHTLLKYLACLAPINTRRYRYLSDTRAPYCVDLPSAKLGGAARHTLLKYLACLAPINTRRYRPPSDTSSKTEAEDSINSSLPSFTDSDVVIKESMKQEKPLPQALKYARS
ncbi:tubulin polyglutamylase TTLL5 isoform X3 [Cydia pomonella]|uniref:tubulin polyglutamylase TTLL5 isoform X3 n=1 Tax=Cydia pomonella TaxID=82600 RepID=UPI002ADE0CCA|nr:tubulin polyglutamylase TTLL5 isoform X3 [Cydia pomonella]